jgi:hypothetical protein
MLDFAVNIYYRVATTKHHQIKNSCFPNEIIQEIKPVNLIKGYNCPSELAQFEKNYERTTKL